MFCKRANKFTYCQQLWSINIDSVLRTVYACLAAHWYELICARYHVSFNRSQHFSWAKWNERGYRGNTPNERNDFHLAFNETQIRWNQMSFSLHKNTSTGVERATGQNVHIWKVFALRLTIWLSQRGRTSFGDRYKSRMLDLFLLMNDA